MSIFVGNLSYEISQEDLVEVFEDYGKVKRVHIPVDKETQRKRGFAFVEMESKDQETKAIAALDGADWMGRSIKVNEAREREERAPFNGGGGDRKKRY
ncbi:MAG: RNA-binding protein [Microcystis panniformis Mp_MB_F_20051200_S9]|uniref:RNA-binding protein n=1 Tax=Microcystis panniformis Mp_MB_F_20051200_S9 TaxID=2486223 RepID=A0A552Q1U8_9CHRO|nr:MAG: RNA-binding protein [Microcystis panniformis Mp_GB_SS_20050300_S99]TRV48815.1 MAG: RNA-binding protein [Microcystis panniformis Mp_GB_SS_20050300_S99D]TRV51278.1 MAG: RNA-binding protein [Microcystis panniformis Mp_MB_F_20080800_S26D]TRV56156.1 MAG: RNA-binding protein [Microcystis panniformis Mp_MB_F_20080800_S26]TRV63193.1 MAG: RNA-binding protein [Microcystis panniformis Mp_MB_F_20051200_S9]TRV64076.1 MAG: RNA-binding protein [Microcystis panniformis Mp_MB_F_20051200_S9D]TRV66796.1